MPVVRARALVGLLMAIGTSLNTFSDKAFVITTIGSFVLLAFGLARLPG